MKIFRICFYSFAVIVFFAALATGRREFFALFFMQIVTIISALILNLWTYFSFSFTQELSASTGVKGGLANLRLSINNDKPFPFTQMRVRVETVIPSDNISFLFNLSPKDSVAFQIPIHCAYRGEYRVGMTVCEVTDVFGLFKINYDMRRLSYYRQRVIKIYPRVVQLDSLPTLRQDGRGDNGPENFSSNDNYAGLRDFHAGDPLKKIHWAASARFQKLMAKTYSLPEENAVLIVLDDSANGHSGEDLLRYADSACEQVCAIAAYCARMGHPVRVVARANKPLADERDSFASLCEALTVLPFLSEKTVKEKWLARLSAEAYNSDAKVAFIITDRPSEALTEAAAPFEKFGCEVRYLFIEEGGGLFGQE